MLREIIILICAALLLGCTSSTNENEASSETIIPLNKIEGEYIPDSIRSNITSKRRGKLKALEADGQAWFNFQINEPFSDLKIALNNSGGVTDFIWPFDDIVASTDSSSNQSQSIKVDVLITQSNVQIFFNESIRYSFEQNLLSTNNKIEVYLDGKHHDIPGVLYDIGM
ncbi:hypothetical protein [Ekhidna sp.]|uniref:hypothetical protein n=1 Tax=Ekhidna sp. TaxID=2608089 RepID=UPI003B504372